MPGSRRFLRPGVERLDSRLLLATLNPTPTNHAIANQIGSFKVIPGRFPSANPNRTFTTTDLQTYASVYLSHVGDPDFAQQYDFNGTGFIGQNDATPILRGLAPITPKIPLTLSLRLQAGQGEAPPIPSNNGVTTRLGNVTVVGKTTPNSIVFVDGPTTSRHSQTTGNYKFQGGALATDSQGYFYYNVDLPANSHGGSLLTANFLIRTPYNQQLIRSLPIRRLPRD